MSIFHYPSHLFDRNVPIVISQLQKKEKNVIKVPNVADIKRGDENPQVGNWTDKGEDETFPIYFADFWIDCTQF